MTGTTPAPADFSGKQDLSRLRKANNPLRYRPLLLKSHGELLFTSPRHFGP
jgi:hypothetical protein